MHERTRRQVCRAGFLLFAAVPTVATVLWAAAVHSPGYVAAQRGRWQAALERHLGLTITIDAIEYPQPGLTRLQRVQIFDPESGALLATVRSLDTAVIENGRFAYLAHSEIAEGALPRLAAAFSEHVLVQWPQGGQLKLVAGEVTLSVPDRDATLRDLRCTVEGPVTGPTCRLQFSLPGTPGSTVHATCLRNRQMVPPEVRWSLDTQTASIHSSLAAALLPGTDCLGAEWSFRGRLEAGYSAGGATGTFEGALANVDLDRLVTGRFPHKLSGTAQVGLRSLRFDQGRVVSANGELACHGGTISRSLLMSLEAALGMQDAGDWIEREEPLLRFEELGIAFELDESSFVLRGQCAEQPGVVLRDERGPLLLSEPPVRASAVDLVRALVPDREVLVPATEETRALLRVLPLPSQRAKQEARGVLYVPLRVESR